MHAALTVKPMRRKAAILVQVRHADHVVDARQHGRGLLRVVKDAWSMAQDRRDQVVGGTR
jgi:hypothetical protein